jgi:acyl-CoA synthetase
VQVIYTPERFPAAAGSTCPPSADPDCVVYLAFTSGTTGSPKCVMHSHNTLLANARDLVRDWKHGPDTVLLSLSPLSHHIAWVGVAQWLLAGCRLVTNDPPAGKSTLDWIIESGATYVMGVPTHAMDVLAAQRARGLARLGRVAVFYMAGAPIPPSVAAAFVAQGIKPQNVYGMTENSSHQYTHPGDDTDTIVATCGRGGPAYELHLFDAADRDKPAEPSAVGEIGGRGAALMLGYFDNQAATEASFNRDGWFLSGDLGMIDAAGNLKVVGRSKDLIIRGGHNIYPSQIEALALRHESVVRVACFPVADERLGERVCIAVTGEVEPGDLLAHLGREGLSRYDMPEYFVALEAFPLTASGKILSAS